MGLERGEWRLWGPSQLAALAAAGGGSGFRVQGSGFRVQGSGCGVKGSGFRVPGVGFRFQGSGLRGCGVQG